MDAVPSDGLSLSGGEGSSKRGLDAEDGPGGGRGKGVKRPRAVLSCTSCVARKTKCDQRVPCATCIKRGDAANCHIESMIPGSIVQRQPFAMNDEFNELRDRVKLLEAVLAEKVGIVLPPPQSRKKPSDPSGSSGRGGGHHHDEEVVAVLERMRQGSPVAAGVPSAGQKMSLADAQRLLPLLPNSCIAEQLVDSFFQRVDWQIHVLHTQLFRQEASRMWSIITSGSQENCTSISPAFLACYFIVCALGLYARPSYPNNSPALLLEGSVVDDLRDAASKALEVADWSGKPSLRCLQAMLLRSHLWSNQGEIDRLVVWTGAATRVAQALRLHLVDREPLDFPHDDFHVSPVQKPLFNAEMGKRCWWQLCVLEWDIGYRCRAVSVLRAAEFVTALPAHLNDEDLTSATGFTANSPRPPTEVTSASHLLHYASLILIQHSWNWPRKARGSGYIPLDQETVASLYNIFSEKFNQLPVQFRDMDADSPGLFTSTPEGHQAFKLQQLNLRIEFLIRGVRIFRKITLKDDRSESAVSLYRLARENAEELLRRGEQFRALTDCASRLWWLQNYTIMGCAALILSNVHQMVMFSLSKADEITARDLVHTAVAKLMSSEDAGTYLKTATMVLNLLIEEAQTMSRIKDTLPFGKLLRVNFARLSEIQETIARGIVCCGATETAIFEALHVDMQRSAKVRFDVEKLGIKKRYDAETGPAAWSFEVVDDPSLNLPYIPAAPSAIQPLGSFQPAFEPTSTLQPFSQEDFDDFFRSLGMPPSNFTATEYTGGAALDPSVLDTSSFVAR